MLDIVLSGQGLIGFREACPRMCHFSIWFIFNWRQFGLQRLKKSILTLTPFLQFLHLKKIRKKSCTRKTAIAKDNIFFFFFNFKSSLRGMANAYLTTFYLLVNCLPSLWSFRPLPSSVWLRMTYKPQLPACQEASLHGASVCT